MSLILAVWTALLLGSSSIGHAQITYSPPRHLFDLPPSDNGEPHGRFAFAAPDTFPPLPFAGAGYVSKSVVADLNGDGLLDFLVGVHAPGYQSHSFRALINRGNGTWGDETAARIPVQDVPVSEQVPIFFFADLDGDGHKDLLYKSFTKQGCCGPSSWVTELYRNNGRGFFARVAGDGLAKVHPAFWPVDVNGDGAVDFVSTCPAWSKPGVPDICVVTSSNVPPAVSVVPNATSFTAGQHLAVRLIARNPAGLPALDVYVGVLLPDGITLAFLEGPNAVAASVPMSTPAAFTPMLTAHGGFAADLVALDYTFPASNIPLGTYTFFAALVHPGALADDAVNAGDLVSLDYFNLDYRP